MSMYIRNYDTLRFQIWIQKISMFCVRFIQIPSVIYSLLFSVILLFLCRTYVRNSNVLDLFIMSDTACFVSHHYIQKIFGIKKRKEIR